MELGTDFISPDKRISDNDFRSSLRMPADEDSGISGGWTWVAALLVAALFIVSGYLDQESAMNHASVGTGASQSYASRPADGSAIVGGGNADYQAEKGY